MLRPHFTNCGQGFKQKAAAPHEAAPVCVVALIGVDGEEALRQIAVGEMKLQPLESGIPCPDSRCDKIFANPGDVGQRHRLGHFGQIRPKRNGRRRKRFPAPRVAFGDVVIALPGAVGAGFAAGMGDLNARNGSARLDGGGNFGKSGGLLAVP